MTDAAEHEFAISLVAATLLEGDVGDEAVPLLEERIRAILPNLPDEPSSDEVRNYIDAMPDALFKLARPLVDLAGHAVALLAEARGQTREEMLADVASVTWPDD